MSSLFGFLRDVAGAAVLAAAIAIIGSPKPGLPLRPAFTPPGPVDKIPAAVDQVLLNAAFRVAVVGVEDLEEWDREMRSP